jgi:glycosyltransferase involved in cell wall biosynthesis
MRVAIVHDDLVQWGGAERVLLGISEFFPEAPIYTLVFDKSHPILSQKFKDKKIITSFLQSFPGWKKYFKATLKLQPIAFEQFDLTDYDLVISQTTRFAKSVITKPETLHLCYCHTPARFLWNFSGEKPAKFLEPLLSLLRLYDRVSAQRPDLFLAGSKNAQTRIEKVYQRKSRVLEPFIDLEQFKNITGFDGGYYLVVARLNSYKRVNLAIDVCQETHRKLKVVGTGPLLKEFQKRSDKNIDILGAVSEELLKSLLAGCRGLIVTAEEDFGLTPLEAQALGKGVVAFGTGGATETIIEGETGVFFEEQTKESLEAALKRFEKMPINPDDCKKQAAKFSKDKFQEELKRHLNGGLLVKQAKEM